VRQSSQGKEAALFFEKRTKKLLSVRFRAVPRRPRLVIRAQEQKFFGSFFQKRTRLPSLFDCPRTGAPGWSGR
jgi:hypothetical protein